MNRAPTLITLLALTACTTHTLVREAPVEDSLWEHLEAKEFPACERDFRNVRDRHECMIDSAWLVWREAGLEWDPEMQNWSQALLTRTYVLEQQARRREQKRDGSFTKMDEAAWERIRKAGDAAVEHLRHSRNRDWQAGYDQGFDDALPPVEDFNKTYGAWAEREQEER